MPYIILSNDDGEIERRELRREITLGRSSRCDITLEDKLVSRRHCRISPWHDTWMLEDLGSHNGTFVNGIQVKRHLLAEGDRVEIGDVLIEFHVDSLASQRPVDPHEARMRAEMLCEVDAARSDEAMTRTWHRPMPQVRVTKPQHRPSSSVDEGQSSPVVFGRPRPSPIVSNKLDPSGPSNEPPRTSLLDRLLGRRRDH